MENKASTSTQSLFSGRRLDSWKQITDHLRCSERTAKRYRGKGMPVYNVAGLALQRVFAYSNEPDHWIHRGKPEPPIQVQPELSAEVLSPPERPPEHLQSTETFLHLAPADDPEIGSGFIVTLPSTVLGRDGLAAIVLADPRISRRHACIHRQADSFFLEDLKSRNGTTLNRSRLRGQVLLGHGDRICLAGAISLRVALVTAGETVDSDTP